MKAIVVLCALSVFLMVSEDHSYGQQRGSVSVFPGYHIVNSDIVSGATEVGQADWVVGGNVALRPTIRGIPFEVTVDYSHSHTTIYEVNFTHEQIYANYAIDLRYRSIPVELLFLHQLTERFELLGGINVTPQDRTHHYSGRDIEEDRLFSMGLGLSGKAVMTIFSFEGGGTVFGAFSVRWTEFIYHDARNRMLDDFTLRNVLISPQIGYAISF